MPRMKIAVLIAMVVVVAGGTLFLAKAVWDLGVPVWAAAMGPILLGLTLLLHLKRRSK
ncbi:MAG: hypothetical protein WA784_10675 [Albidovulum sp.]|jgi:hypothetical protein